MKKLAAFALAAAACTASGRSVAANPSPDPWIARDKALHFDVSAGIAAVGYAVSAAWLVDARGEALAIGGGVALGAGAGKELLDLAGLGDPSWKDFAWDAIGTLAGLAVAWSVDMLLGGVDRGRPALGAPPSRGPPRAAMTLRFQ